MPSGLGGNGKSGQSYPITYSFGLLVLLALAVLVALRYFYGAIRVEGGVRLWRLTGRG
jgi:hypothetical protein